LPRFGQPNGLIEGMHVMRIAARVIFAGLALLLSCASLLAQPKEKVDLLLVLAADVSRSINDNEFALQRKGYASAVTDQRVVRAMKSGPNGRIGVIFVEWSDEQDVLIDWTIIDDHHSARRFAEQIANKPRSFGGGTAIGSVIRFAAKLIADAPFVAERRVIDISGDGTSNCGWDVSGSRDLVLKGDGDLVINGLVIINDTGDTVSREHTHPPGGLENYYRAKVIGGPGAFVMVADGFQTFGQSLANKMIAEIAMR
jgi:uncharacterized protein DUF1194